MGTHDKAKQREKVIRVRRFRALTRSELREGVDFARAAPDGAVSPMVKRNDPETERLINEALAKRGLAANRET